MNKTFDAKEFFTLLLKRCWLLILAGAIGASVTYLTTEYNKTPLYTAYSTVYISNSSGEAQTSVSSSSIYTARELISTYVVIMKSNKVIDQVKEKLGESYSMYSANTIKGSLGLSAVNDTEILRISATTANPERSIEICNAVAAIAPGVITEIIRGGNASVIDEANETTYYLANPKSLTNSFLAGVVFAGICVGILLLIYLLDTRIRSADDIRKTYKVAVLGEIPNFSVKKDERYSYHHEEKE